MAGEIVYADLNLPSGFPGSRAPLSAQPLGARSPRWHRTALWVGWIGNLVLVITLLALGMWVSQLTSEKGQTPAAPGSDGAGSRDTVTPPGSEDPSTEACSARLELFRSQLIQSLCHPTKLDPPGGSGCKLCPSDWRPHRDKCYWVSRENKMWNESRSNCVERHSQLLVIEDQEELEALQDLTQGSAQLWVGLSHPSPENTWTWVNGSRLDQILLRVQGPARGNSCGALQGNQIHSQSCTAALKWICQRDAVPL
ncbi:killer cell lectin-like receptor subfamily B member 1B allele B [Pelodiscus sinensis]|uniref:killer cell lectin-like receptor subfamily B member 1B allele B n=1 Tax=Pelodiscus sinensis TaxID=13735 RepID=UPI003F6B143F